MILDELLANSSPSPNADVDCFSAGDALGVPQISVVVDELLAVKLIDAGGGLSAPGSGGPLYLGQAQNAPLPGYPAIVRVAGFSRCTYGATIAVGDRLKLDPTTSRVVPFNTDVDDGHTHAHVPALIRRVVKVTDIFSAPITGAVGDFTTTLRWDDAGSLNSASEPVTVTEIAGGLYYLEVTPVNANRMYFLEVECTPGAVKQICQPDAFQFDAVAFGGRPVELSLKLIIGRALIAGVDGDPGIMLIEKQIF